MLKRIIPCLALLSLVLLQAPTQCLAQEEEGKIRVLVWDSQQPAQKSSYKNFLGNHIAEHLKGFKDFEVKSVRLDDPGQGLSNALLDKPCHVGAWPKGRGLPRQGQGGP